MKKTLFPLLLLTTLGSAHAQNNFWTEDVWVSPDRGFLFYQEKTKTNPEEVPEFASVEELRAEAQRRLNVAVMEPTDENIKSYLAINTVMLEKSMRFAERWKETLWANPAYDHTTLHPNANFAQVALKDEAKQSKASQLKAVASHSGLVVLVQNGCSFCDLMAPIIESLKAETGMEVLTISIKNGIPNSWPEAKPDNGIVKRLVTLSGSMPTVTPAVFLVDKTGEKMRLVASCALALEELKDRLISAAGFTQPQNSTIQTLPRL